MKSYDRLLERGHGLDAVGGLVGEVSLAHDHARHQVADVLGVIDDEEAQRVRLGAHDT